MLRASKQIRADPHSTMTEPQTARNPSSRQPLKGTEPITSHDSQTVMISAERHDNIKVEEVVTRFSDSYQIPESLTVIRRVETYHGPELMGHSKIEGSDWNYLLTAPGRHKHLYLWVGDGPVEGKRRTWEAIAEIKASLPVEQPPYEKCKQCGETIRTIEHEREAISENCSRANTL